ncbi:MAG: hypothetical protein Q9181_005469 [Wetmoreana brouardii]
MGVPFEALIPYGIGLVMFGITGAGLSAVRAAQNGGKPARHSVDQWDRQSTLRIAPLILRIRLIALAVMDRDRRLTGFLRGQTDNPKAPPGFELNSPWRLEDRYY